jgi:hypothetical protein
MGEWKKKGALRWKKQAQGHRKIPEEEEQGTGTQEIPEARETGPTTAGRYPEAH